MTYLSPGHRGVTPQGRGRFPGYDVLSEVPRWDEVTAGVVLARLAPSGDLSFFTAAEEAVAVALLDLLLAQDREPRVPVVALLDARLAAGETDGWRYDDMPEDSAAWRGTLAALDEDARAAHATGFAELDAERQARLIERVRTAPRWHGMPGARVWSLWTRYACTAFYSHPFAWNEIGFGGPAYPRGYKNLGDDSRERWEVPDRHRADPVSYAERVERAHTNHADLVGHAPDETPAP